MQPTPDDLETLTRKKQAKLSSAFLTKAAWLTDYDKAREESLRRGVPILAYFTLSHFVCLNCAQVEAGVFSDERFADWAQGWVLYMHLSTAIPSDPHQDLLGKLDIKGWPELMILDGKGELLAHLTASRDLEGLQDLGRRALAFLDLRRRAGAGDRDAEVDLLLAQHDLGTLPLAGLRTRREGMGALTEAQRARLDGRLADGEVREVLLRIRLDAGARFLAMKARGLVPASDKEAWTFWNMMMEHAEASKDLPAFQAALDAAKARFHEEPNQRRILGDWERKLRKLGRDGAA